MNEKISNTLKLHKQLLSDFGLKGDLKILVPIIKTGEELSLVIAGFKCQKCKYDSKLQFHHLIMRTDARFINDRIRYMSQRHYWGNILILCERCHNEYHGLRPIERDEKAFIGPDKLKKVKEKYREE